jgi:hypothetical protein
MPATLTRDQMRLYQRARRARLKAEREAGDPIVDAEALPRTFLKEPPADIARMWAKADAIGPGAVITKTNGRLDVLKREDFEARGIKRRAPASMAAIGGRPGRGLVPQARGYALPPDLAAISPFTHAEQFRARTETMLATLAAKSDQQERRLAALEAAAADRRATVADLAQAIAGLFSYAVRRTA